MTRIRTCVIGRGVLSLWVGCAGILAALLFTGGVTWEAVLAQGGPGSIQFVEITSTSGLTLTGSRAGIAVSDFDGDAREDLTFNVCSPDMFYRNVNGTTFSDVTGIWTSQLSGSLISCGSASYYADFDNDGDQDLVRNRQGILVLWRNERVPAGQDVFTQVATFAGSGRPTVASWMDVDNDGDLDLFVAFADDQKLLLNRLVETGSPDFEDVTSSAGLVLITGPSLTPTSTQWADVDLDGDADLFVGIPDGVNIFYLNLFQETGGQVRFEDRTATVGLGGIGANFMYGMFADYDNDTDLDLIIGRGLFSSSRLYRNELVPSGTVGFSFIQNIAPADGGPSIWADLDNDGDLDLMAGGASNEPWRIHRNELIETGSATFIDVTAAAGVGGFHHQTAITPFDLDNDGDLDAFLGSNGDGPSRLLRNTTFGNNWLEVELRGTDSNRDGVGAHVTVTAGGRRQTRYAFRQSLDSQHLSRRLHFGLGQASMIDEIRVQWPSGNTTIETSLAVNQRLDVVERETQDSSPPEVVPDVTGTLGENGWYRSDVGVLWNVSDPESTVSSMIGCSPESVTTDTGGVTFTCEATSAGGSTSRSVTVKRDATAPTISGSATPGANSAGWNNTDVTISYTAADNLSGIDGGASSLGDDVLTAEGAGQSASGTAVDQAGNAATSTVGGINIDKTAPAIRSASSNPGTFWPPNHQMVGVQVAVTAEDVQDSSVSCAIMDISSNEPVNGLGDGDTAPDWLVTGGLTAALRAERAGSGSGRTYTLAVACSDDAGNTAMGTAGVNVPKSQGSGRP